MMVYIRRDHFPDKPDILNDYVPSRPRNIDDAPLSAMPGDVTFTPEELRNPPSDAEFRKEVLATFGRVFDGAAPLPYQTKFPPHVVAEVKAALLSGCSAAAAGRRCGVGESTVRGWVKIGLVPAPLAKPPVISDADLPKIRAELNTGRSINNVARMFNLAPSTLAAWVKRGDV